MVSHLKVLLKKNILLFRRSLCCSITQILLPVFICCFLYIFRATVDLKDVSEKSYLKYDYTTNPSSKLPYNIWSDYAYPDNLPNDLKGQVIGKHDNYLPWIKNCINGKSGQINNKEQRNGDIALSPKNEFTEQLASLLTQHQKNGQYYTVRYFDNEKSIQDYVQNDDYGLDLCLGISMRNSGESGEWKYALHFNATSNNPKNNEIPNTEEPEYKGYLVENQEFYLEQWTESGFIQIQNWLDNIILRKQTNNQKAAINIKASTQRIEEYTDDDLIDTLKGQLSTYLVLPIIIIFLRMSYSLLVEKEKKIKEGMKIMGLSDTSFYLSWMIYYFVIYLVTAILVSVVITTSIFKNTGFSVFFIWYLLYCVSLIFQSLFITTFFTRAKVGNIVAMVFYLAFFMASISVSNSSTRNTKRALSIFSQTAISFGSDVFLFSEIKSDGGIQWDNLDLEIENYTIQDSFIMMILNIIIFGILAFYLDQVFPNEFGKKRHPLFFLFCLKKCRKQQRVSSSKNNSKNYDVENATIQENIEQVGHALIEKEENNDVLKINDITKVYPNKKKAVDSLSMKFYKDHITCLLGHNGAGKTSTIQMLTGMQEISEGYANAFGYDVTTQMDDLRKIMGVCPQHDILYDDLTCKEHLELYAAFKGVDDKDVAQQVEQMLIDVDLISKKDQYSKTLSGGQKRRLSVAIAFIGNSKLIYLDEPTSGMDTSARRHIWEMLQKYKQDKIVVLTTHFMDEADVLGDRIAIMGGGKLICLGSSQFLKDKFGVGYNLTIVKSDTNIQSQPIKDFVTNIIPNSIQVSDISAEIQFQLSMKDISKFQELFDGLDAKKEELQFQNYGISITTMEEVFLKVAEEGQSALGESHKMDKLQISQLKKQKTLQKEENKKDADDFDLNSVRITNSMQLALTHFYALSKKRLQYFKRDYKGLLCEVLLPCLIVVCGLAISIQSSIVNPPENTLSPTLYDTKPNVLWSGYNAQNNNDMTTLVSQIQSEFNFKEYFANGATKMDQLADWDLANFKTKGENNRGTFFINAIDTVKQTLEYFVEISSINRDALPIFVNRVNTAFLRQTTNNPQANIKVTVAMFKNTVGVQNIEGAVDGFISALIFSIAIAFIPASMIAFTVKERQDQVKHQQLVSGVSIPAYWFSNLAIDLTKYYFPFCLFSILMVFAFDLETFTQNSDTRLAICLLFILLGFAIITFSYVLGFAFKEYGNAQVFSFFFHFMIGGILTFVLFILRIIESTRDAAEVLKWFFRIFPSFCFGSGVINLGSRELYSIIDEQKETYGVFHIDICGADIVCLAVQGVIYFCLVFVLERLNQKGTLSRMVSKEQSLKYVPKSLDADVQTEQQQVQQSTPKDYTVRVEKLRKVFKTADNKLKEAVDQISFGVKNGECFTLLGINGAGKTTTFKILSGDIVATEGNASINGYDVTTDMKNARKYMGYCPQFDALLDNLTAKEHLELYAAIKGIPQEIIPKLVEEKLQDMELMKFKDVCAGTYSGGNKRKLSVAIAMLGNPPICFLDEPSTGMDPKARRYMWNVISKLATRRKQTSVILTTHSMEEAEALSTKIAIMVAGQLKCIGSIQHIKSKFGKGYEVEIKVNIPKEKQISAYLKQYQIPESTQITIDLNNLQDILKKLNKVHLMERITPVGDAQVLYTAINSAKGMKINSLAEYILIDEMGEKIKQFIGVQFGKYSVIEHYGSFFRFKIESNIATGKLFGTFEKAKEDLNLQSYNVRQATIEQIFNMFARDQIPTISKYQEKQREIVPLE